MTEITQQMPDLLGAGPQRPDQLPRRPRRRFLNRGSATLLALVTCAIGFYIGVRVEKSRIASTPTTVAAGGNTTGARRTEFGAASAAKTGATGAAGFAARFGGAGGGSTGTVASVDGKTLVLTETGGNTVKVALTSATKITKTETVGRDKIHPGDAIVVSGVIGKSGTLSAATITDSGASASTTSGTTGASSSSDSSAVGSLFSGG